MDRSTNNYISGINCNRSLYLHFFKNNLTVPKTKDLVKKPTEQYQKIYNSINNPKEENKSMKSELKNFIQSLNKKNQKKKTVESVGGNYQSASMVGSYSNY